MAVNRKLVRRVINNLRGDRYDHCVLELRDPEHPESYCAEGVILQSVDPEGWTKTVDNLWVHRLYYDGEPYELAEIFNGVDPLYLHPPHDPKQFGCADQTVEVCNCSLLFEMSDSFGKECWPVIADYLEDMFITRHEPTRSEDDRESV